MHSTSAGAGAGPVSVSGSGSGTGTGIGAEPPQGGKRVPGRRTHQRRALLRALIEGDGFVSAQSLHAAVLAAGVRVGLSTVYRTLAALGDAGLVDVVRDANGERLFRHRPSPEHRHYLMCRDCGTSSPVEASAVEDWARAVAEASGFTEVRHTVELTGVCGDCHGRPGPAAPAPPAPPAPPALPATPAPPAGPAPTASRPHHPA